MAGGPLLMGATMGLQAAGTAISASSTIAGGNNAAAMGVLQQQADQWRATQMKDQEGSEIGAAQRQMLDTQFKTKMLQSTVRANAAAGGVNAATGSPAQVSSAIAQRGQYQSLMDLWQGQNRAVGLENEATGLNYSGDVSVAAGEMERQAAQQRAAATIAGGGSSLFKTYYDFTRRPGYG